jgi:peptide/nickel transport system permease protein
VTGIAIDPAEAARGAAAPAAVSPWRDVVARFQSDGLAVFGLVLLLAILAIALLAPWIAPQNPYDIAALNLADGRLRPGSVGAGGRVYWLGSDEQGRDVLSAIMYGLRISLAIGVASSLVAMLIGTAIGLLAARLGGVGETLIMRLVDFQLSIPAVLLALVLVALVGSGADKIFIALVAVQWAYYARTARGTALVELEKDYMAAAQSLRLGPARITFRHLLPNCLPPILVVVTIQLAAAIALEATLSFLGLGMSVTEPSLGLLLANGYQYMISGRYWMSVYPGIALLLLIVAINLVGDRLREILNPRLEK